MASNMPYNHPIQHHDRHGSPSTWSKAPYGYGDSQALAHPHHYNRHGDMSRAVMPHDMSRAMGLPHDMSRAMGLPHDMSRAMGHPMELMNEMSRVMADPAHLERNVRHMEHAMQREMMHMQHDMERMMKGMNRPGSNFSTDLVHHPSRPASVIEHYSLMNPIRMDAEGNRWLNCCFDLRSFKPEEINVELNSKERCINVEANHEVRDSKDHYVKRHYARKFFLPDNMNCDLKALELKSCLNNDGLLCLEASLPKLTPEETSHMSLTTPHSFTVPIPVKHV